MSPLQLRSPRVRLEATATLDDGQREISCRVANISRTGLLVYPDQALSLHRFLRVRLSLPGQDGWRELEAFQVREARGAVGIAWGLQFIANAGCDWSEWIDRYVQDRL